MMATFCSGKGINNDDGDNDANDNDGECLFFKYCCRTII